MRLIKRLLPVAALCAGIGIGAAWAQNPKTFSGAYVDATNTMMKNMDITFTGNADTDFARGSIALHQAAIDIAKAELQYGEDEKLKGLAQDIIDMRESDIALTRDWLKAKEIPEDSRAKKP
ncbi:MAG: DUF305 domain-containing protein [Alphaproteobacteria bacterium]